MKFSRAWAMPNKYTFQIGPIREFIGRYYPASLCSIDPFAGTSDLPTHGNDLANGGIDAVDWLRKLYADGVRADLLFLDPPYSPRQISECYKAVGRACTGVDTQNARLYKAVKDAAEPLLLPGAVILSFGWNSSGFGRGATPLEYMLVCHGGAHNDTICVAERMP